MFGTIRKHRTWLWVLIAGATIFTFVFWGTQPGSYGGGGRRAGEAYVSPVNGRPVNLFGTPITYDEFVDAYQETRISHFIRSNGREWPGTDEATQRDLERDTIYRVLLVRKLEDLDIHVSHKAVARVARERIGNIPYDRFVKEILEAQGGVTSADFERFASHEAGIQQLVRVAAVQSKLVNPQEAELLYRKDHEEVATDLAVFWATNYLDQVAVTPQLIQQYFTNELGNYRVRPRLQVSYVEFPATNFLVEADQQLDQSTNLNAYVEEQYYRRGTNSFRDTNDVVLSAEAAKEKIREQIREQFGLVEARKKASEFGAELYNQPERNRADNLERLAAARGYPVKVSPPFERFRGLEDTELPTEFYAEGWKLTRAEPIRFQPVVGDSAVFVISLKTNLPTETPRLEEVQDKVTLDFQHSKALELARAAGTNFHRVLTDGLAQKKSFTELCLANQVKTLTVPAFSASTRSLTNLDERVNLQSLQRHVFDLEPGQASEFIWSTEGGMILHLRERLPFDEAKVRAELPEFLAMIRGARVNDSFNKWFSKQAEQAQLVLPQKEQSAGVPGT